MRKHIHTHTNTYLWTHIQKTEHNNKQLSLSCPVNYFFTFKFLSTKVNAAILRGFKLALLHFIHARSPALSGYAHKCFKKRILLLFWLQIAVCFYLSSCGLWVLLTLQKCDIIVGASVCIQPCASCVYVRKFLHKERMYPVKKI